MENNAPGNILIVANYPSDVGYAWWLMENFWVAIGEQFGAAGKHTILMYPQLGMVPDNIRNSGIRVIEGSFMGSGISGLCSLVKTIREHRVKYIYLTDRPYFSFIYMILRLCGVKKIVNHDHMPGERNNIIFYKKMIKKLIHDFGIFSCDFYFAVSEFVKDRLVNIACVPEDKCVSIHNGIKIFDNQKTDYANRMFDIPEGSTIIVSTGRAVFYKGIDTLIDVAGELVRHKNREDVYFLYVGDGPDIDTFKSMVAEKGLSSRFIFAGYRKDVSRILPSCDIGIQVSHGEAFSLSLIEYLCAGLVTLAPGHCGNGEAIDDGRNGLLFTPGDVAEIVEKIEFVLDNEEEARRLAGEARKTAVEKFSLEACNEKFIALLRQQFI